MPMKSLAVISAIVVSIVLCARAYATVTHSSGSPCRSGGAVNAAIQGTTAGVKLDMAFVCPPDTTAHRSQTESSTKKVSMRMRNPSPCENPVVTIYGKETGGSWTVLTNDYMNNIPSCN
jgi:hypothetical protein